MENFSIFYDHLEYFTAIWYILWTFGIVYVHLVYFPVLVFLVQEKSGNPGSQMQLSSEKLLRQTLQPAEWPDEFG
jgi:hypothetical protein